MRLTSFKSPTFATLLTLCMGAVCNPVIAAEDPLYARLNAAVESAWDNSSPGLMVGIEIPGRGRWEIVKGLANINRKTPMRVGMGQPVGSITKTLTATILLQLVDEGRISLDDKVSKWFPEIPKSDEITVGMILNMTSGITDFIDASPVMWNFIQDTLIRDPHHPFDSYQMMMFGVSQPRTFDPPGAEFSYSNTDSLLQARIAERVTGLSFKTLLSTKILKPLGMTHSYLNLKGGLKAPATEIYNSAVDPGHLIPVSQWTESWGDASGSLVSTVRDLQRWAVSYGTGRKVLSTSLQPLRSQGCHIKQPKPRIDYCFGGAIWVDSETGNVQSYFHNGNTPGASSWLEYFPSTGASLVVLSNRDDSQDGSGGPPADLIGFRLRTELRDLLIH